MTKPDFDALIIGGGVVGLSCAYELAQAGRSAAVLERHARFGEETSTHNSGVIHAGIYYPTGSWKARLCVEGREILRERLAQWKIAHTFCGKLILAVEENEIPILEQLERQGRANGVNDLQIVGADEARRREPHINPKAALFSPSTGVFDVAEYLHLLAARAQAAGSLLVTKAEVVGVEAHPSAVTVRTAARGALSGRRLINAAGLDADRVAALCGDRRHTIYPCRGEYATVIPSRAHLINGLVYPVPSEIHLGVHLTKTAGGELWLGPDAKYIDGKTDYETNRRPAQDFYPEAQRLCPELRREDLRLGPSGIRPKRVGPGQPTVDFFIERQPDEPRIIHLIGLESPGLTAAPAIGRLVVKMMEKGGGK